MGVGGFSLSLSHSFSLSLCLSLSLGDLSLYIYLSLSLSLSLSVSIHALSVLLTPSLLYISQSSQLSCSFLLMFPSVQEKEFPNTVTDQH